jgi:pSer/pThr/pTyr-binding forkhead associated (FHA) protein
VEFWIGSAANNHLCLSADDGISGNHACIRTEQSFRRLYDNGSLNNTWLNGRAIGQEVALLQPGDRLRLGASDFLLEANGDA